MKGKVKYKRGDILRNSEATVVCVPVNCEGKLIGSSFINSLQKAYPSAQAKYVRFYKGRTAALSPILGCCHLSCVDPERKLVVAFLFIQKSVQRNELYFDALRRSIQVLARNTTLRGKAVPIAFPHNLGLDIDSNTWRQVERIIRYEFSDYPGEIQLWAPSASRSTRAAGARALRV